MVYFKMQDLIGKNSVEAYTMYVYYMNWLTDNLPVTNWDLDCKSTILINGVNIPQGITFYNFQDAINFIRST
jgi:hypothetical protein